MNASFSKAIRLLAHPAGIAAAVLIVVNDWILRPAAPSAWTGKLSDIGALVIWPLLFAAVFSLLLPRAWTDRHDRLAGAAGMILTLAGYLLLKASPLSNQLLLTLSGYRLRAVADPSDLWVLPALLIPAWLWFKPQLPSLRLRRELLAAPLILLVGLADAAAPDYGVVCFFEENGQLIANSAYYRTDATADGGYTWAPTDFTPSERCDLNTDREPLELSSPGGMQYRVTLQEKVEQRAGEGQDWQVVYTPQEPTQAENTYREQTVSSNTYYLSGPLDAVIEPATGNLLVAMGLEGVLVLEPDGDQVWAPVAEYRRGGLRQDGLAGVAKLLSLEILLAILVGLAWWNTATRAFDRTRWQTAWVVIGWIILLPTLLLAHPDIVVGYLAAGTMLAVIVSTVYLVAIAVTRIVRTARRESRALLRLAAGIPLVAILFFLPYILWAFNVLPEYLLATLVGAILALAAGWFYARQAGWKA